MRYVIVVCMTGTSKDTRPDPSSREVQVADAATITARFTSPAWGESNSGNYLANKFTNGPFSRVAGETKPALGVVMAIELALYDYVDSLQGMPEMAVRATSMDIQSRKDDIAQILGADAESCRAIQDTFAAIRTFEQERTPPREITPRSPGLENLGLDF